MIYRKKLEEKLTKTSAVIFDGHYWCNLISVFSKFPFINTSDSYEFKKKEERKEEGGREGKRGREGGRLGRFGLLMSSFFPNHRNFLMLFLLLM